jgi:ApbE superfamily uncharacterized protein (UPF0280 family)
MSTSSLWKERRGRVGLYGVGGDGEKKNRPCRLELVLYVAIISPGTLGRSIGAGRAAYLTYQPRCWSAYNTTHIFSNVLKELCC